MQAHERLGSTQINVSQMLWGSNPLNFHLDLPHNQLHHLTEQGEAIDIPLVQIREACVDLRPGDIGIIVLNPDEQIRLALGPMGQSRTYFLRTQQSKYIAYYNNVWQDMSNGSPILFGRTPDVDQLEKSLGLNAGHVFPAKLYGDKVSGQLVDDAQTSRNHMLVRQLTDAEGKKALIIQNVSTSQPIRVSEIEEYREDKDGQRELKYEVIRGNAADFAYAKAAHIGNKREKQEDRAQVVIVTFPDGHTAAFGIVADGMGGHDKGDLAAQICIDAIPYALQHYLSQGLNPADALAQAVLYAHQQIKDDQRIFNGGATIACILLDKTREKRIEMHVGDARTYAVQNGTLTQIGKDHSWAQDAIDLGQIKETDRRTHQYRNMVTHNVGEPDTLDKNKRPGIGIDLTVNNWHDQAEYDAYRKRLDAYLTESDLVPGTGALLCSDGLWEGLEDDGIQEILRETVNPMQAVDRLIGAALQTVGNNDNISAIVLQA